MAHTTAPSAGETGRITIDLDAIASNWQSLAETVAPAQCAAVVKANAYGLGARRIVPVLAKAGCSTFFVATLKEAEQIKTLVGDGRIFVLDGILPGNAPLARSVGVIPVLSTPDEINEWQSEAKQHNEKLSAALHIDSGLNRLGLSAGDVARLAQNKTVFDTLSLDLVMSHLASADVPDAP